MENKASITLEKDKLGVILDWVFLIVCTGFTVFHLITAFFGNLFGFAQAGVHISVVLAIAFLREIINIRKSEKKSKWFLIVFYTILIFASLIFGIYIVAESPALLRDSTTFTKFMGYIGPVLLFILLVACWKFVGPAMAILAGIFIIYALFGKHFPTILRHAGMKPKRFIQLICFCSEGIFGAPLSASATYIGVFIALGAMFNVTGIGDYLCEAAKALMGRFRGGPAKVAVVSSCLFGSISGSAVANVVGTGTFTIPLMKKTGYDPVFAGAVEASSSTGGALMPPVMGAAAFLLAEIVGVKYWKVCTAAIIPALLYYIAIILQVDLYALGHGLKGLDKSEMPPVGPVLRDLWKLSPLVLLVVMIGPLGFTVQRSGIVTLAYTFALSFIKKEDRFTWEKAKKFFISTATGCIGVAVACASAGIIIGSITGAGLSIRISSILVKLAGGKLAVLLILVMIASIILGMGLPVSACYLMLATLVGPAIVKLGVSKMAAHLFILYFGVISNVTPPVAMAAYAGAGIADCNPTKCGYQAFRLSLAGFVLPFFFVYNNQLLLMGSNLGSVIRCCISALLGIYCLACMLEGYIWNSKIHVATRVILTIAAFCLIKSDILTDIIGVGIVVAVHLFYNFIWTKWKKKSATLTD